MSKTMTEINELLKNGESEKIEFKKSSAQLERGLKAVCAFSNHRGGSVYFGIPEGKVIGQEVSDSTLRSISQKIRQKIKPEISPEIKVLDAGGKKIIEVGVKEGKNKLYYPDGVTYKRVGTENLTIPPEEIERIILEKKREYWDSEICEEAGFEDIDEEKVKWFLRKAKYERNFDVEPETQVKEALERLGLVKNKKLTNAAILLFGKKPQKFFLQAEVRCGRFKGTEPLEFIDMKVFGGNIINQRDDAVEFVKEHIRLHAKIVGTERVETWEYPLEAVREAITNTICHRDYGYPSKVQIRIFDDRIEVWGCGTLPEPLTPEDLKKKHRSILRNPLIGKCLFLIKFIEEWGTGTNRIIEECIKHGLPEPLFEEITGCLVVTFRKPPVLEDLEKLELKERQIQAVDHVVKKDSISNKEYQKLNQVAKYTATRDLTDLVRKGVFKTTGSGKRVLRYILSAPNEPKMSQKMSQKSQR